MIEDNMATYDTVAISVKSLSKKYRLFNSPEERFKESLHPFKKKYHKEFWALKDISIDVKKGSTVGIIGRNGSGKSTLLQTICGVLRATSGEVTVNGRISALLELGAGFNPELTGRQNAVLNGIVQGFSKEEMNAKIPRIEEFADIGEFFDQPVKIYSSGMFVRLAFASAINVDPDILIVDEALAVGDAKFQHKCYNKFLEFQGNGKTILFVTHSTEAVVRHCDTAILLDHGRVIDMGDPKTITNYYMDLLFTGKIHGYASSPVFIDEGYRGFNIVHYGKKYYTFSQSLGQIDLDRLLESELHVLMVEHKCAVGSSLEEVKQLVDRMVSPGIDISNQAVKVPPKKEKTELERFLEEIPAGDNCVNRRSYNKDEYRYGDRRAEIVDYLIVAGNKYDPMTIDSGEVVDIYVKIKCLVEVSSPMYGFAIKNIDGMTVYANNTRLHNMNISKMFADTLCVIKWSIKFDLNRGDVFLNLGVAEKKDIDLPIDIRKDIIHLCIQTTEDFVGLARFETSFSVNSANKVVS
jgi:ABC-type polysaccharide/polyol phosphate transport system ATPase subunit